MNKRLIYNLCFGALFGTLPACFVGTTQKIPLKAIQTIPTNTDLPINTEVIREKKGEVPALVRVELSGFCKPVLKEKDIRAVAQHVKKTYGPDVRIAFVLPACVKQIGTGVTPLISPYDPAISIYPFSSAFYDMHENLEEIIVPPQSDLEDLGAFTFGHCRNLRRIGDRNPNPFPNLRRIGRSAFLQCWNLTTTPFNRNTPLIEIDNACSCSGCDYIEIPETLQSFNGHFGTPLTYFVPKESKIKKLDTRFSMSPVSDTIHIESGIKSEDLVWILGAIFRYRDGLSTWKDQRIVLDPAKKTTVQYEEDSVVLDGRFVFGYHKVNAQNVKLCFSSSLSPHILALMNFINIKDKEKLNHKDYKSLLSHLSPELVMYAFSQRAGAFLQKLEKIDEDLGLFFFECFSVIRFICGISCFDLFEACPEFNIDPELIKSCLVRRGVVEIGDNQKIWKLFISGKYEEKVKESDIIDIIEEDDIDQFQEIVANRPEFSLDEKFPYLSLRILTGFRPHTYGFYGMSSAAGKPRRGAWLHPNDLHPIELAALLGATEIFKYIFLNFNKQALPKDLFWYACFGGNPEIIHIVEHEQLVPLLKQNRPSALKIIRKLLKTLPYPDIIDFLKINYIQGDSDLIEEPCE